MVVPKINPTEKHFFLLYYALKKTDKDYSLDFTTTDVNIFSEYYPFLYKKKLIDSLVNSNYIETKKMFESLNLENEFSEEEEIELSLFLFSHKIFQNLQKKKEDVKKFENLNKILKKYEKEYFDLYAEFFKLKKLKDNTGTLQKMIEEVSVIDNVITRFPPEPSGILHIGHAKAALINYTMATKNNGKMIVRFDDTNPLKEYQKYVDAIQDDIINILGIKPYKWSYSSDYFGEILELAKKLIIEGNAYCDATDANTMKEERTNGIKSQYRDQTPEENMNIFEEMNRGKKTTYCLRAKIDYQNLNKSLRDPVIYRYIDTIHHRTKDTYKIYPTYDLTCPIVDSLENVTHSFRSNEYRDRNELYYWMLEKLDLKNKPKIKDFSRLNFEKTVLSKRKLRGIVENHGLQWDDPRMPTLRGIKRLGIDMDVFKNYLINLGINQTSTNASWDKIWAENKQKIDISSKKYLGIDSENYFTSEIINLDELKERLTEKEEHFFISIPYNKKKLDLGMKEVKVTKTLILPNENYEKDDEITLMNLGNFIIKEKQGNTMKMFFNKEGSFKTTSLKAQWVSATYNSKIKCIEYKTLCTDDEGTFNTDSPVVREFICECEIDNAKEGETIQIERVAFFYKDKDSYNQVPYTYQVKKKSN